MANSKQSQDEPLFGLWISVPLEADYRNSGAFPGLRIDKAAKHYGTQLMFHVPLDFAHEVLRHAKARKEELRPGRGLYQSYRALVKRLEYSLNPAAEQGAQDDPGPDAWGRRMQDEGCHEPGTRLIDGSGNEVLISKAYGVVRVPDAKGPFRGKDGGRFHYRYAYHGICHTDDGLKEFAYPAGMLYDRGGEITDLRLVWSAP